MKLLFIWIEKYKKLIDFQTTFSGKYNIKYFDDKLIMSKNKLYIDNFFNINRSEFDINLSAIVGENGIGKSTILDLIVQYIECGTYFGKYIVIFENNNKIIIDKNFEITSINVNDESIEYEVTDSDTSLDNYLENCFTIFFSNVFDVRFFENNEGRENYRMNQLPRFKNISTNYLLNSSERTADFLNTDFSKQIFFVNKFKSILEVEDLVNIPEKIYIKLNNFDNLIENVGGELTNFIEVFANENVSVMYFNLEKQDEFKEKINKSIIQSFCISIGYLLRQNNLEDYIIIDVFENYSIENLGIEATFFEIIYKGISEKIRKLTNNKKIEKKLTNIYENYKELINYIQKIQFQSDFVDRYIISSDKLTDEFINFYYENLYLTEIFNFYWSEMSSGQLSILNLFGRFHDALTEFHRDLVEYDFDEDNSVSLNDFKYLLLLDECDLYFHPQWQKDWLFYFLKLIEILFKGNVQVILTTHSPFILSDFPNTNVIFLKDKSRTLTLNNEIEGSTRTFGANINELFTNSFFIEDGVMGKFAKNKINNFIRELINYTPDEVLRKKIEIKMFIDIIGEPFIKNRLLQIYNDKILLATNDEIENKIKFLEDELNRLKKEVIKID